RTGSAERPPEEVARMLRCKAAEVREDEVVPHLVPLECREVVLEEVRGLPGLFRRRHRGGAWANRGWSLVGSFCVRLLGRHGSLLCQSRRWTGPTKRPRPLPAGPRKKTSSPSQRTTSSTARPNRVMRLSRTMYTERFMGAAIPQRPCAIKSEC